MRTHTHTISYSQDLWIIGHRRQWHPTPVLLPGKSHGWRSLVGCSPWGCEESDTTERLHFDFSLSCIGGGNGNPLQYSCLENPRDRGACWAAIYGVAQSRTRLKRLSSSSSSMDYRQFWWGRGEWEGGLQLLNITHSLLKANILGFPNERFGQHNVYIYVCACCSVMSDCLQPHTL